MVGDLKFRGMRKYRGMGYIERFHTKYVPVTESGCWIWLAGCIPNGYGMFKMPDRRANQGAHRCSWMIHRGPVPAGMQVCHKCDTPSCVNPDHLFLGTNSDNAQDKLAKGRANSARGEKLSKLSPADVIAIRCDTGPQPEIAAKFGICQQTVSDIRRGNAWRHAPGPRSFVPSSGEGHAQAKLSEAQVRAIRADTRTNNQAIASDYGVSRALIGKIKKRKSWAHVA